LDYSCGGSHVRGRERRCRENPQLTPDDDDDDDVITIETGEPGPGKSATKTTSVSLEDV